MIPEQIITALLMADAAVQALIEGRVCPTVVPEGTRLPAVAFRRVDAIVLHRPLNPKPGGFMLSRARMRVVSVSSTEEGYVDGKTLMQAVRKACSNKIGSIAGFEGIHVGAPLTSPEMPDPVTGLTMEANDFMVTFREPT